jgi:hypothetical protein
MATLAKTNKHLATDARRKDSVYVTVSTSSAIEGIHAPFKRERSLAGSDLAVRKREVSAKTFQSRKREK